MNKLLRGMACLTLVAASALALSGCGGYNDFIMSNRTATIGEGEAGVQFSNTSSFALDYQGDNTYVAKGEANQMTQEQADAFWKGNAQEGDDFVVLSINFNADAEIVYGFESDNADFSNPDGTVVKQFKNDKEDDVLDLILRVKRDGSKTFKVIDTEKEMDSVTYTVDFTKMTFKNAD